jgi:glycogen debranching enzyme
MSAPLARAAQAVYLLPLTDSGAPDVPGSYIYLPPPPEDSGYILRFQIEGCSSICRQGSLWVNVPAKGHKFKRSNYREYKSDFHLPPAIVIAATDHVAD